MSYVVVDKLLKLGGRLGFVITQSLFKTSGAGQGFRRFEIPQAKAKPVLLRVVHVDDMVELNPFEGASNRTAVMVLEKGSRTRYPTPYTLWRREKGAHFTYDSTLEEVVGATSRSDFAAAPVDIDDTASSWLTARAGAIKALRNVLGVCRRTSFWRRATTTGCGHALDGCQQVVGRARRAGVFRQTPRAVRLPGA
jgi:hypothetical protein